MGARKTHQRSTSWDKRVSVSFESVEEKERIMKILKDRYGGSLALPDSAAIRRAIVALTKNG